MKVAVKYGAFETEPVVDERGELLGQSAGVTLIRRLLRLFPDPILIGSHTRRGHGFAMMPLEFVDAENTLGINMDAIGSIVELSLIHI